MKHWSLINDCNLHKLTNLSSFSIISSSDPLLFNLPTWPDDAKIKIRDGRFLNADIQIYKKILSIFSFFLMKVNGNE